MLINTVHDSIYVDTENAGLDFVVESMYNTFDDLPKNIEKLWGIKCPIAFPGEVKIGHNLGEMEKHVRNQH